MRVLISWPMSVALFESERPKSSANSDTERSQNTVSVALCAPSAAPFQYSGLS